MSKKNKKILFLSFLKKRAKEDKKLTIEVMSIILYILHVGLDFVSGLNKASILKTHVTYASVF